jgi:hypothetical protein
MQYFINSNTIHQINTMSDDTEEERTFRQRYAQELGKKKQQDPHSYRGYDELADERRNINQQEMKTPGRRGEKIKHEEIDKEMVRRDKINRDKESDEK